MLLCCDCNLAFRCLRGTVLLREEEQGQGKQQQQSSLLRVQVDHSGTERVGVSTTRQALLSPSATRRVVCDRVAGRTMAVGAGNVGYEYHMCVLFRLDTKSERVAASDLHAICCLPFSIGASVSPAHFQ